MAEDRIPVIIGVGEVLDRPDDPGLGLEPLALMQAALRLAEDDGGGNLIAAIDSLDIVNLMSWRYADPAKQLTARLGIAPRRAVYGPIGGESPVRLVHEAALRMSGGTGFDALELYSCFPCVPKMARRTLGLGENVAPTVTGGLTFFGAPLNNYMTHAICAMARRMRGAGGRGLVYGQGEFVTKHHAIVLSGQKADHRLMPVDAAIQAEADMRRGPVPAFVEAATGAAALETFTVIYDRDGRPAHGVVLALLKDGRRTMARVPADDTDTIDRLIALDRFPIGDGGILTAGADGISNWQAD